jgi:xylose isomerase
VSNAKKRVDAAFEFFDKLGARPRAFDKLPVPGAELFSDTGWRYVMLMQV